MSGSVDEATEDDSQRRRHPLAPGIELLTLMVDSDQDAHGVRELASRLDVSPSTVHRLVTDLESLGLVSRTSGGSYRLGLEFMRLAWTTNERYPLQAVSAETVQHLTEQSGESAFFGVYSRTRHEMMFTLTVESPHPLRYTLPKREWIPLHAGASGLAILAFLPEAVQRDVVSHPLRRVTERTVVERADLLERLATIRKEGYSLTHGERIEGAIAIAAPVFGPFGEVVGSTGITIPEARFNASQSSALAALVREAAERLSSYTTGSRDLRTGLARH